MIGAGATAVQRRHTRRKSLIDQLWADEVHMGVQRACSDDHLLARLRSGGREHERAMDTRSEANAHCRMGA